MVHEKEQDTDQTYDTPIGALRAIGCFFTLQDPEG